MGPLYMASSNDILLPPSHDTDPAGREMVDLVICSSFVLEDEDRKLYSFASTMWFSILVPLFCNFLVFGNEDRKLYSSASTWWGPLILPVLVAGSLHDGDNTEIQEDLSTGRPDLQGAPGQSEDSSSEDLESLRQEEWARAEETYGLLRPDPNEGVVYVHRQTTSRFAIAPVTWDPIPVGHNVG